MRIYSFQIHTEFGDFDEVYNYESYDDMVKAWKSKKESYVKMVGEDNITIDEDPVMDELGEVYGNFQSLNTDDSTTSFKAYDYDVMSVTHG